MNYTPRVVIASYLTEGKIPEDANTLYYCSSCYSCYVQCPRGVPLTDFIYFLKRIKGDHPKFYLKFKETLRKKGKVSDLSLGRYLFLNKWKENLKRLPLFLKLARRR